MIPEPVIGYAIEPKKTADQDKFGNAIGKLIEEDTTLQVNTDEETGQTIIRGMGELHLEIIIERMRREFKVEVNQGAPQVAYKEALTKTYEHREVYKKQTGGRGTVSYTHLDVYKRQRTATNRSSLPKPGCPSEAKYSLLSGDT